MRMLAGVECLMKITMVRAWYHQVRVEFVAKMLDFEHSLSSIVGHEPLVLMSTLQGVLIHLAIPSHLVLESDPSQNMPGEPLEEPRIEGSEARSEEVLGQCRRPAVNDEVRRG